MVHHCKQAAESNGRAGHFQAHIKTFSHVELAHNVAQVLPVRPHGAGYPHFAGKIQAVVVNIGDDHMAGAHMAAHSRSHDPDGPGPGNQHVLTHQVKGQSGMHGVAKGVEHRGQVIGNIIRQFEGIDRRQGQIFGEAAGAVHAHANGVAA